MRLLLRNATTTAGSTPAPLVPPGRLRLTLTAFSGGNLRVRVAEPDSRRFEPTSSLRDDLGAWEVSWGGGGAAGGRGEEVNLGGGGGGGGGAGLLFDAGEEGGPRVLLSASPFRLDLLPPPGEEEGSSEEKRGARARGPPLPVPLAVFNGAGGLLFQRRGAALPPPPPAAEGASGLEGTASASASSPYPEELFKSHRDSVPFGPQAVGFDLSFPGAAFVSGLPERAKQLALPATLSGPPPRGQPSVPGIDAATGQQTMSRFRDEPYRLYNLDVFEYLDDSNFGLYGSIPMLVAHSPAGGVAAAAASGNAALQAADAAAAATGKKRKKAASSSFPFEAAGGEAPRTVGAFWNNAAEMYVDVATPPPPSLSASAAAASSPFLSEPGVTSPFAGTALTTHWLAEAGVVDLFLYSGLAVEEAGKEERRRSRGARPSFLLLLLLLSGRRRRRPRPRHWHHRPTPALLPGIPPVPLELPRRGRRQGRRRRLRRARDAVRRPLARHRAHRRQAVLHLGQRLVSQTQGAHRGHRLEGPQGRRDRRPARQARRGLQNLLRGEEKRLFRQGQERREGL